MARTPLLVVLALASSMCGCVAEADDGAGEVSGAAAEDRHGRVQRSAAEIQTRLQGAELTFTIPVTLGETVSEFDVGGREGSCVVSVARTTVYQKRPVLPADDVYAVRDVTGKVMLDASLFGGARRFARYVFRLEEKKVAASTGTDIVLRCDLAPDDFALLGADLVLDAVNQSRSLRLAAPTAAR